MFLEKDNALLSRLITASKEGKLDWAPTGTTSSKFVTALSGKYVVSVGEQWVGSPSPEHYLRLETQDGISIQTLTDETYPDVKELYEFARRRALKVDEAIDDILKELDS